MANSRKSQIEAQNSSSKIPIVSILGPHNGLPIYSGFDRVPNISKRRRLRGRPRNYKPKTDTIADTMPVRLPEVQSEETASYVHKGGEGRFSLSIFVILLLGDEIDS